MSASPDTPAAPLGNPARKRALTAIATVVALAAVGWGLYEWLVASHYESTDNAYVQGNVIQITPRVSGPIVELAIENLLDLIQVPFDVGDEDGPVLHVVHQRLADFALAAPADRAGLVTERPFGRSADDSP